MGANSTLLRVTFPIGHNRTTPTFLPKLNPSNPLPGFSLSHVFVAFAPTPPPGTLEEKGLIPSLMKSVRELHKLLHF